MAKIALIGEMTDVEITIDPEDAQVIATCRQEGCGWTEAYDDLNDATEYAADHADRLRGTAEDVTHWDRRGRHPIQGPVPA